MKLHNRLHKKSIDRFILLYKFYKDPEEFKNGSFSYKEGNYTISLTNDGIIRILGPKESSEYNLQQHVGKDFRLSYSVIKDWYGWVSSKSEDEQVES